MRKEVRLRKEEERKEGGNELRSRKEERKEERKEGGKEGRN